MFLKESKIYDDRIIKILGSNFGFIQGSETKRDVLDTILKGMYHNRFYHIAPSAIKIGLMKFHKFQQYSRIFPEYKLFFIGDNGQGDLLAGKMMLKDNAECLVFIHNILYQNKLLFSTDIIRAHTEQFSGRLFFFKN